MSTREYIRVCKQDGCGEEFIVSAPSLDDDRAIGFSEPEYCPKHRIFQARSYSRIACHHLELEMTPEGEALVRKVEAELSLASAIRDGEKFDPWDLPPKGYGPGGIGRYVRKIRGFRNNAIFQPEKGPKDFQIAERSDDLLAKLEEHRVIVLVGTTGSGKSTYIPWLLLTGGEPGKLSKWAKRGPICVTQPRIQATRQVPEFIAHKLNGTSLGPGGQVGFSHSGADEFDRRTRLIFKTDGKLINDIVSGAIANYSIVMIDEAHERSVNIDLILGLLKDQLYLYPQLRVIIASATINEQTFLDFFGLKKQKHYVFSQGRHHDIHKHWWGESHEKWQAKVNDDPKNTPKWDAPAESIPVVVEWWKKVNNGQIPARENLPRAIAELVQIICTWLESLSGSVKTKEDGHILVFLPGSREIDQTVGMINALGIVNTIALPLYSQRPLEEQQAALKPDEKKHRDVCGKRRVVVSTNVAETSLTVEGVKHVIETGFIKESYWNTEIEINELRTVRHSKAGCKQRWGRAGRVTDGHAYMFYTEEEFDDFPNDSTPEIARSSLEQVLLTAKRAGVRSKPNGNSMALDFEWMPLPDTQQHEFRTELGRAYEELVKKGAIDQDGDLTPFGLEMGGFPATLQVARIYTEAEHHAMAIEAATLLPFLKLERGLQSLLNWDKDRTWDTMTKYEIRLAHQDLVFGCRDDLELYLKLWILWDSQPSNAREEWCKKKGIDSRAFTKLIAEERQKLLDATMDWRKAEGRNIILRCIDALRALIASCLPNEIYVPIEQKRSVQDDELKRDRFALAYVSSWFEYEEYDDSLSFDESITEKRRIRQGIYCRHNVTEVTDKDQLEIAPSSMCFDREDARLLVACQRTKNWRRPARTKALGMNMIRLDPQWLPDVKSESIIQRTRLYAKLKRTVDEQTLLLNLFLPWLVSRGQVIEATVEDAAIDGPVHVRIDCAIPDAYKVEYEGSPAFSIKGYFPKEQVKLMGKMQWSRGVKIKCEIDDYELGPDGISLVRLGATSWRNNLFQEFSKRHQPGQYIVVEMVRLLDDPMGRNPLFIVRDVNTGLEIPMADSDFCGNTRPQAYFGLRFQIGEQFKVKIETIDVATWTITLSRTEQLIAEYLGIIAADQELINVTIRRVDPTGIFVEVPTSGTAPYVSLVKHAMWPSDVDQEVGTPVEARLRRFERQISPSQLQTILKEKKLIPQELDLGIELDLRGPKAFDRFVEVEKLEEGQILRGTVEKQLDNGGLIVRLAPELVTFIFPDEMGLNEVGNFRQSRDYRLHESVYMRVFKVDERRKKILCSLFRYNAPPDHIEKNNIIDVEILAAKPDRLHADIIRVTGCYEKRCCVKIALPSNSSTHMRKGDLVKVRVLRVDRCAACYIEAEQFDPDQD